MVFGGLARRSLRVPSERDEVAMGERKRMEDIRANLRRWVAAWLLALLLIQTPVALFAADKLWDIQAPLEALEFGDFNGDGVTDISASTTARSGNIHPAAPAHGKIWRPRACRSRTYVSTI